MEWMTSANTAHSELPEAVSHKKCEGICLYSRKKQNHEDI